MFCQDKSAALKRYQKRTLSAMVGYFVILFGCVWLVKHVSPQGWPLYLWAVLPAVPIILVMVNMGLYLKEETDEYLRLRMMRSLLVATAALLGPLVVSDFVRAYAHAPAFPPFVCFVTFCLAFGIANGVQKLRDRATDE
ncbi:hypothetical protein GOB94_04440 [Granulicella sp. 5B5]|uniref:hypothetical protein n=1 Tax=Granulicella sp. 5B5 TaxID=1617967 RepID=UPI0015F72A7C|nr:hypothetical protein [Granulicella sp. 5B5]QMV18021.1 hypothetical protein GOB94_04440 [Granulicella sp. 5B5]